MAKGPNQKLKLLYLYQILLQKTDEEHKMSMDELLAALSRRSAKASTRISPLCRISGWMW